jgi:hypothetical protein
MSDPHIVSDSEGKLHLTYDGNVGSYPNKTIIYKFYNGNNWSAPDTLNKGYIGAMHNRLVIDSNDRIYCFWYIDTGYGKMYYRLKDVGFTGWSDVIMPYDTAFFYKIVVGPENTLNIIGAAWSTIGDGYHVIFYKYDNTMWATPIKITPPTFGSYFDMSLDTQTSPHIIWTQYSIGNGTGIDSSMYRYKNSYGWQPYEFIHSNVNDVSIIVDNSDNKHVIEVEKLDNIYYLVEYQKYNEKWEANIIDENSGYGHTRLLCKSGFIYLVYVRVTSNTTNILLRKKEVISSGINNNGKFHSFVKIYPNPASNKVTCSITIGETQNLVVKIYDQKGNEVKSLFNGEKQPGEIKFTWDGNCTNGEPVRRGVYILSILTGKDTVTKKIIMH